MKQIYLSAVVFVLCVIGLIFIRLGVANPWLLLVSAFVMPVGIALVCIFVKELWIYGLFSILLAVAHILFLGYNLYSVIAALLWLAVVVSLPPMVRKDLSTRVKLNIIEVTRRPVKWVLFLIAVSYAVIFFNRYSSTNVIDKMVAVPKFELQVIALSYPEVNKDTTVNQFINVVTGNNISKPVDVTTRQAVLNKLGVKGKTYSGNEKIADEEALLNAFIGGRLQEALGRFEPIVPLLISITVWQALILMSYIVLPLLLALVFEIFLILVKYKFAEVDSYSAQKEEIRL